MKHADFHIGLEFFGSAGFRWRCTDVGTRTILAIHLDRRDPNWYQGPPYIAKEVVFDEEEMKRCDPTWDDGIRSAVEDSETSAHPGYPSEDFFRMFDQKVKGVQYPNKGVLRFDRLRGDGEILHAYGGRKAGKKWVVLLYLPFTRTFEEMPESEFIALPRSSEKDLLARKTALERG